MAAEAALLGGLVSRGEPLALRVLEPAEAAL